MTRPPYVRGQLPVVTTGDWQSKKQTQPNPLRLNTVESETYAASEKSKPIEVKEPSFSEIARIKGCFSGNMNGARSPYSRFAKNRSSKLENRNWTSGNSKLGTKLECRLYSAQYGLRFSLYSRLPKDGNWKMGNQQWENRAWCAGLWERVAQKPNTESRIPNP
jgi:hypothetical protein